MNDRIRFALLFLVLVAFVAARAGGALGAGKHVTRHVSRATATARKQARIVRFARRYLGVRYVYGGTSPRSGFDCSGFTRFVYAHFGIALPHYSGAQFGMGRRISERGLRPGDLVFFDGLGHVGLYIGGGRFIHAPHTGASVSIDTLSHHGSYDGARRLL
ncbi:MAG TPA: NlpC/P60 family protein [Gaiellaceae bacterium]|jgi:cell wall-associated NlpC family hydrolase|nr:NlpC/P60 family protein [Gaiellaceae bacterium]